MFLVRASTPKEFSKIFPKQEFKLLQYCYVVEQHIEMKGFMFWNKEGFYKPDEPYMNATGYMVFNCVERIREQNLEQVFLKEFFIHSTNKKELSLNMIRSYVASNNNDGKYKYQYNWNQ